MSLYTIYVASDSTNFLTSDSIVKMGSTQFADQQTLPHILSFMKKKGNGIFNSNSQKADSYRHNPMLYHCLA
jgi:hypothetical protein